MVIPKINSAHGSDTRNILNRAIDLINVQGKSIQDLVAEGQLTPAEYAELLQSINGLIAKGDLSVSDFDLNKGKITQNMIADSVLEMIAGNAAVNAVPPNNSLTTQKYVDKSVTSEKRTDLGDVGHLMVGSSATIPDLNLETGTLTIYPTTFIVSRKKRHTIQNAKEIKLGSSTSQMLVFDTLTKELEFIATSEVPTFKMTEDKVILMTIIFTTGTLKIIKDFWSPFKFTIDGRIETNENDVRGEYSILTPGATSKFPNIDMMKKEINIYDTSFLYYSNKRHTINEDVTLKFPTQTSSLILFFDTKTGTFHIEPGGNHVRINETSLLIMTIFFTSTTQSSLKNVRSNFDYTINGIALENGVDPADEIRNKDYIVKNLSSNEYYNVDTLDAVHQTSVESLAGSSHTIMYDMWDELMNRFPEFISRKSEGVDDWGNNIYRYDVESPVIADDTVATLKPKVFWNCSVHGSEKTASWVAYQSIKQMLENWEDHDSLENLLWNTHFVVLPVANPSGWDDGTRTNRNGVDINRNMPAGWIANEPNNELYSGDEPLSEKEARVIYNIITQEENLKFVIDFHNFFIPQSDNLFIWIPTGSTRIVNLGKNHISKLSRVWKSKHDFLPQDNATFLGYSSAGSRSGTIGNQAVSLGIYGGTFEVCERFNLESNPTINSSIVVTLGTEAFINWNILVLKNLTE